jgi:LysR family transcriptional regulator, glycine cleavage system transcriptional activator
MNQIHLWGLPLNASSISLPALRSFDAAARTGSFKDAASNLGVTPTAVSHQIRTLEDQLGVALFVRTTRNIVLTQEGSRLAAATSRGFREIYDAVGDLRDVSWRLTISTTPAFAALWLIPRLADFEAKHPATSVHVETSTKMQNLERDRRIDVAIRYGEGEYAGLAASPLAQETFGVFAHPELLRAGIQIEDAVLIETRWRSQSLRQIGWDDWLTAQQLDPATFANRRSFDQEQHSIQAALAGQGLILASNLLVQDMLERGWLVEYQPETRLPGLRYTAVALPRHSETRKVRQFLAWLTAQAGA